MQNASKLKLNMSIVKMKTSSLKKKKSIICLALLSWKMLNPKSKRCMKAPQEDSRTDLHHFLIKRVRCEVMCHGEMCGPNEGNG